MVLKMSPPKASEKSILFFLIIPLFLVIQSISAQNQTDTAKKTLLASLETKSAPSFFIRKSNVVFPEILKGNEEEMLPYIEKFSSKKRDYLISMYTRGKNLLPKAATILNKYSLPAELSILLTLESEYKGDAVSKAGAVGYWQIMDEFARDYNMKFNTWVSAHEKEKNFKLNKKNFESGHKIVSRPKDDRNDFNKSTHAAARYLRDRKRDLNDNWLLVVASYNCGLGNVKKAIKKSAISNPTFWDIKKYLPAETKAYVMNFITLNVIFNNYDMFAKNKLSFAAEKVMLPDDLEKNMTDASSEYSDR